MKQRTASLSAEVLRAYVRQGDRFFVVAAAYRPGAELFVTRLEYENNVFDFFILPWEGDDYYICAVPMAFRATVEQVATEARMRLADGVPTMFTSAGIKRFPIQGQNVWNLENDPNHRIYLTNQSSAIEEERQEVARLRAAQVERWKMRRRRTG